MTDRAIPDLDPLTNPADDDVLAIADVSAGQTYKVEVEKLRGGRGNVLRQGADPTGVADSSAAFQLAADSDYMMVVPPGTYKIDSTVVVTRPKIIQLSGGMSIRHGLINGYGDTSPDQGPNVGEQAHVFTENNINLFEFQTEQIHFSGGLLELKHASADKACFNLPAVMNGQVAGGVGDYGGWGGSITNVVCAGDFNQVIGNGNGAIGVYFNYTNGLANGYFTHWLVDIKARNLRRGIYCDARQTGLSPAQWGNNCQFRVDAQNVKTAIHNESINSCDIWIRHQGQEVFDTEAEADVTPGLYLRGSGHNIYTAEFFDFNPSNQDSNGHWSNRKTYDMIVSSTEVFRPDEITKAINYQGVENSFELRNTRGIIPTRLTRQMDRGVFMPQFHDQMLQHILGGTVTVAAYKGTDIVVTDVETDFTARENDGITDGITTSAEITINNSGNIGLWEGASGVPSFQWTQAGIDDDDYVEIYIANTSATQMDKLWIYMDNTDGRYPKYIQVMRGTIGTMSDNVFITVDAMSQAENYTRYWEVDLGGSGAGDIIIRFIGASVAGESLVLVGLFAGNEFLFKQTPNVDIHGNKDIFGALSVRTHFGLPTYTTAELNDSSDAVNTSGWKKEGVAVFDTTADTPMYATGNGDTDTWVGEKAGSTITLTPS